MQLFRTKAVQSSSNAFATTRPLVAPVGIRIYTVFALSLAIAICLFVTLGRYAPRETVRGTTRTTIGDVAVYSQSDGTITTLLVSDGQAVRRGEPLMRLDTARATQQTAVWSDKVAHHLEQKQAELQTQYEQEVAAFELQDRSLIFEIATQGDELQLLKTQYSDLQAKFDLRTRADQRLNSERLQNYVAKIDLDRARAETLELKIRLSETKLAIDRVKAEIERQEQGRLALPMRRDARDAELRGLMRELQIAIAEHQERRSQVVVAPQAGIVSALLVRTGQTINSRQPLMTILPENSSFYVELLIPSRAVGFVSVGAPVNVRFDAYPFQTFGSIDATVSSVAETTVLPTDRRFDVAVNEPVFLAKASLPTPSVLANGRALKMQSGMSLTADVLRDERRIIEWIFAPLLTATGKI